MAPGYCAAACAGETKIKRVKTADTCISLYLRGTHAGRRERLAITAPARLSAPQAPSLHVYCSGSTRRLGLPQKSRTRVPRHSTPLLICREQVVVALGERGELRLNLVVR